MTGKELEDKSMRIIRRSKGGSDGSARGNRSRSESDYVILSIKYPNTCTDILAESNTFNTASILLIEVMTIRHAETEPACRENSDAGNAVHRIIFKGVRRTSADISGLFEFQNRLEISVHREIQTNCV